MIPMQVKDAKDFLVQQATEQAALEGIPLSDLEKRMMYFTEGEDKTENPAVLNHEFEAMIENEAYELKIYGLLRNAYKRLIKENPTEVQLWSQSIRDLKKGDHYLLVLWAKDIHRKSKCAVL
jgi:hypothetical protein